MGLILGPGRLTLKCCMLIWSLLAHPGAMEAHPGPLEVYLLAVNAHPGALEAHSVAMEAHPGGV
jgi:hypothetical protein